MANKELAKAKKELAKATPKQRTSKKGLVTVAVLGTVSAVGYYLWKRSQPVEDPWAEAYWEDISASANGEESAQEAQSAESADEAASTAEESPK